MEHSNQLLNRHLVYLLRIHCLHLTKISFGKNVHLIPNYLCLCSAFLAIIVFGGLCWDLFSVQETCYLSITTLFGTSVTRLGDFKEFLATKVLLEVSQIFVDILGNFKNITSLYKQLWLILGDFWKHLGYFLFHHMVTLLGIYLFVVSGLKILKKYVTINVSIFTTL